jgi:23S rRNA (guanine2445-N2)-methyltransferase / 23S rRNA (guanine2069-N7)-methyltransferase
MSQLDLIATAAFGLEAVVARELRALGYPANVTAPGRVLFHGNLSALCRANLWLRSADRVLLHMGTFEATDFGRLFDRTYALPWEQWIGADAAFPVKGRSIKSQLSSVPACQKMVKKAIVEKLKAVYSVQWFEETGPQYSVEVALLKDQATLTIDTSGPGLHKRGYRTLTGPAPLKETLAAAMILLSFWRPERPLIDPFCGTGTIPIEAALIGRNLAPGLNRDFAAESWPRMPAAQWEAARQEARDLARPRLPIRIIGADHDDDVLSLARHHAQNAGVAEDIHFQRREFVELSSKQQYGCVIGNPPYGARIGQSREVEDLYHAMPIVLRRLKTWSHYLLTAHPDFETLVGRQADRRRKLYNGRIECTYYQFHGPKPASPGEPTPETKPSTTAQPTQAFGGISAKARGQAEMFRARLTKRRRHLRRWPTRQGITCYRLYDRDIPEVPLVVDRYEDRLHMAEYERPHDRSIAEHADWLDLMVRTAGEVMEVHPSNIFMKYRDRQRGKSQYERRGSQGPTFVVSEGGLKFQVNLSDYIDTGLFLDHRITRSMVRDAAAQKRFLNLFGYTGSFTVYAADGGARATTTVDLSNTYLDWAQENMQLNGFTAKQHRFVRDDAMDFLRHLPASQRFDLAVVDPPTYSRSKSTDVDWDVQAQHVELLNRLLQHMTPGGVIFFSTNFRRFKFAESEIAAGHIHEISRQTVPPDFRNRRIHRCWKIVCGGGADG